MQEGRDERNRNRRKKQLRECSKKAQRKEGAGEWDEIHTVGQIYPLPDCEQSRGPGVSE